MIKPAITQQTRVGEFPENFPELEELLISLALAFQNQKTQY
jgi:hypothetical protein